jgi:hypothetical protein
MGRNPATGEAIRSAKTVVKPGSQALARRLQCDTKQGTELPSVISVSEEPPRRQAASGARHPA